MELQRPRTLISQQSTVWTRRQHAVCVRRAYKRYGTTKNPYVVLDNLNMTVPKGTIYGLLGASGCGKTTLLSCIVGRRRLNSGEIWVLGGKPGSKGSGVPGPRIGYMPQELALYGEFTIRETMLYFGWVAGMTTKQVDDKIEFLVSFLQLPPATRPVKNLSGGQKRRVSLAAALVHDPELLILDEPTVGVDPLLRQNIWDHLVSITKDNGTTVIITTHYIDETRQAGLIGLMRGGRFLAEESPSVLLQKHNCESLEEVFLKLSILQNRGKRRRSSILAEVTQAATATMPELGGVVNESFDNTSEISGEFGDSVPTIKQGARPTHTEQHEPLPPAEEIEWTWEDYFSIYKPNHMKALIWKNSLWMLRNVPIMLFIVGLPVAQIIIFCLSIGHDPVGLKVAILNNEVNSTAINGCLYEKGCKWERFSCRYIEFLEAKKHVMKYYDKVEDAVSAVRNGQAWGLIEFPEMFSQSLKDRVDLGQSVSNESLDQAEISVRIDMSNQQIALMLKRDIIFAFLDLVKDISQDCQLNEGVIKNPIRFNHPIYGPAVPNFTDFAAPGVMLTIIFFLAVALTSGAMLVERNEGILERSLVCGITGVEILTCHVFTQFLVMLGQSIMVLFVSLFVFPITNEGNILWIVILFLLNGTCGMCYGFVVSCMTDSERNATYLALGSFLPFVMLCGIIWPVEGMNTVMKTISFFLPLTLSTESLRSILARGWSIYEPTVYYGFISVLLWIIILMNASVLLIKFKKG